MYINCKTYYSFRYGTISAEELVETAVDMGVSSMALTNINNTCDAWDFVKLCKEKNIKPILGVEIKNENCLLYILLAVNSAGFQWINSFISSYLVSKENFPDQIFTTNDVFIIYPLGYKKLHDLLPNEFLGIRPSEINKIFGTTANAKYVILQPVTYQDNDHYQLHRLLRAADLNILGTKLSASDHAGKGETFISESELLKVFKNYPFIVTNTYKLMEQCNIVMEFGTSKNKKNYSAKANDDRALLKKLAYDGMHARYGNHNKIAEARVNKELVIINDLGFNAYFLIAWDLIRYARSRKFYHVGRGSGANSIVSYCLQITDVDPIELDLYFERFLNPYRTSPPDFDIDFSWLDRDEMIDYVFKRYGSEHVALLGSYATFKRKAVIRQLAKVFGLPKKEIDELIDSGYWYTGDKRRNDFLRKNLDNNQHLILKYGKVMEGFPDHMSIHAGGMLITEEPIHAYTATWLPPKGFVTSQMDMYTAEMVGLYKVDVLSQRGLGHIKETIRLVKQNRNIEINIHETEKFRQDLQVQSQIKNVNTIGCFYIESPAMRQLLKKLECEDYITLVAASSIIRPGVASSGMMREYIFRHHNENKFTHIHPIMKELMQETYGVMVYQEDVIKVAHHFAGLDMGEADILRRAMSGKYRGNAEMLRIEQTFFINCKQRGYPDAIAKEVWRQIESFGGYSFSKAHSASFAVESFQDLFLKTYYPMEFMVGVINNFGGFYQAWIYFYELLKINARLHLPCVNESLFETNIRGNDVYMGLQHIKDLQKERALKIIAERVANGKFLHLQDFIERTNATPEHLNILISIGAFRFTGKSKKTLLWEANFLQKKNKTHVPAHISMFHDEQKKFMLPALTDHPVDDMYDEMDILGYLLRNPFELVDDDLALYTPAKDLIHLKGKQVTMLAFYVTEKDVPTKNNSAMAFGTFIDVNLDWIDTVHFPPSLQNYQLQGMGFYKLSGKVVEDYSACAVEVSSIKKVGYKQRKYANL